MFIKKVLAILAAITIFSSASAFAADISVKLNGEDIKLQTPAYIKNERTMVPLRGIFEAVGAKVSWDNDKKVAIVANKKDDAVGFIFLYIGSDIAYINGEEKALEAPAEISNDSTMVPLRFIMENLGANVQWDADTYTVNIIKEEVI